MSGDLHAPPITEPVTDFFADGSPYLAHPLLTPERTSAEVDHVLSLGVAGDARVLDVGCGAGRHAIEFARRGHRVVAVDPSVAMLSAARERGHHAGVDVEWRLGSAGAATDAGPFDLAVCLFTTLGQVADGESNDDLLATTRDLLEPGGLLVVEVPQRDVMLDGLDGETRIDTPTGTTVIRRSYDAARHVLTERFTVTGDGEPAHFRLAFRLFSADELRTRLGTAGYSSVELFDGYASAPATSRSPTLLAVARA